MTLAEVRKKFVIPTDTLRYYEGCLINKLRSMP